MRRWTGLLSLLLLMLAAAPARADDGALGRAGETVYPINDHEVRMAAEEVRLKVSTERTDVDVTFTFVNDGPARDVLMGFPVGRPGPADEEQRGDLELHDFHTWLDGQELAVRQEKGAENMDPLPNLPGGQMKYAAWITWTVRFAAGQTRTVRNQYWGRNSYWSNGEVLAGYILQSGQGWKGPIGSAVITAELDGILPGQLIGIAPAAFRWDDAGRMVWRFRDFEPDRDIHIRFTTRPLVPLNDPTLAEPVYEALGKSGPDGLKVLQAARLKRPNPAPAPDDLDLVLADYQYRYGDRQAAIRTADAALKAGMAGHPIVPYIAWKEGLRKPAELLALPGLPYGLKSLLMDAAGLKGAPPVVSPAKLGYIADDLTLAHLSLPVTDPDGDLDDWRITVWPGPSETGEPLITRSAAEEQFYENRTAYTVELDVTNPGGGDALWYRATAADGRGQRTDTGLVKLDLRPPAQPAATNRATPTLPTTLAPTLSPSSALSSSPAPQPARPPAWTWGVLFIGALLGLVILHGERH